MKTSECPECGRDVLTENKLGTGFMANCGRRVAELSQCSDPSPCPDKSQIKTSLEKPCAFSVFYRNPGHWDIVTGNARAFRIRGEEGAVTVYDEREDKSRPHPREPINFRTVNLSLAWCADELMQGHGHVG